MRSENSSEADELDSAAEAFVRVRPRLFGIAYRMLGIVAEAEDIVQEVWLRWQQTDRSVVLDSTAFLATATTRLAINVSQSARSRLETYIGPWLPEPVDTSSDPLLGAEQGEALRFAVLLLLERLSAPERAAYILREAFDYPYSEIAKILELSEANSRQLVSRARKHISSERSPRVSSTEQERLLKAFLAAAQRGDLGELEELFAANVVSYSDGGGVVRAARVPVEGGPRVARFISAFASHFWVGMESRWIQANGQSSVLLSRGGVAIAVLTIEASTQGIDQIMWVMNPAKLATIFRTQAGPDRAEPQDPAIG